MDTSGYNLLPGNMYPGVNAALDWRTDRPAKNAEDQVENEERADDDEADEVNPWPRVAVNVVDLTTSNNARAMSEACERSGPKIRAGAEHDRILWS